jgi:hypothetical protein
MVSSTRSFRLSRVDSASCNRGNAMLKTVTTRLWRVGDNGPQGRGYMEMHDSLEERILLRAGFIRGSAGD